MNAIDKSVRDLPVKVRLRNGQIIVEQETCGIIFSFPAAAWPKEPKQRRQWIERLSPQWDIDAPDWSPTAARLRESVEAAINKLLPRPDSENREPLADRTVCPTCRQDMDEIPHPGLHGKDCPQCGQGLSWRRVRKKK